MRDLIGRYLDEQGRQTTYLLAIGALLFVVLALAWALYAGQVRNRLALHGLGRLADRIAPGRAAEKSLPGDGGIEPRLIELAASLDASPPDTSPPDTSPPDASPLNAASPEG